MFRGEVFGFREGRWWWFHIGEGGSNLMQDVAGEFE